MIRILAIYFFLILGFNGHSSGQSKDVIDSLETLLKSVKPGKAKVDIINNLSYEYYDYNDSIGLYYSQRALEEALRIQYAEGIKYAYLLNGIGYLSNGNHTLSKRNLKKSFNTKLPSDDVKGLNLYALSLLGSVYRTVADYDSAQYYYTLSRKNFNEWNKVQWPIFYKNNALLFIRLWQNKLAIAYLDSAMLYLNEPKGSTLTLDIWTSYGEAYQNLRQEEKAKFYFEKACNDGLINQDYFNLIKCVLNRTRTAYRKGDYAIALNNSIQALNLLGSYSYPPQQTEVLIRIGEIYLELSDYTLASKFYLQALALAERYDLKYEKAYLLGELSWIYKDQNNYKLALDYIDQSQKIRQTIGDKYGLAICYNTRGLIYLLQKKYSQSIEQHERARLLREAIGHTEGVAASLFNISLALSEQGNDDKAFQYLSEAIRIEEGTNNKQSLAISYDYLASLLIKKGRLDEAEKYLIKCRNLAEQTKSKLLLRNNAGYFSDLYEAKGDFKNALKYRKYYQQLNDSIYSQSGVAKLAEMQALYQIDKMDEKIKALDRENALKESNLQYQKNQLKQQRYIIIVALTAVILISGLAFIVYLFYRRVKILNSDIYERNEEVQAQSEELTEANQALIKLNQELSEKKEEIAAQSEELQNANEIILEINRNLEQRVEQRTEELRQAYKELDTFFYRSSHDFRRPLTTFMGLAEVARVTVKDEHALELFLKVNETAHYLDKMLFKLQSISDLGANEIVLKEVFIKDIFDNVCDIYRVDLNENHFKTYSSINIKVPFKSYPALLKIIFENLIENSIFFLRKDEPNPFLSLTVSETSNSVLFQFEDNGQGISDELQERIFEMYFRGSERSKGNGLGLYIVKKAIEKLGGSITVRSKLGKGTIFMLEFKKV